MKKVKYKKIIPALFGGLNFKSIPCVVSATITSKPVQLDDGDWYWLDASGVRDGVLESVAILGNGTVQIDFGLARVGENFTYSNGSAIQNDTVPVGGVWTVPNTVKVNTFTTLDGNIFNLENADQARIWSVTSLNETIDILNVTIGSDVVIDNRFISYANQYGYRLSGSEIIPPYLVDGKAISAADGNVLDFKGKVRVNPQIVDSNVYEFNGTTSCIEFTESLNPNKVIIKFKTTSTARMGIVSFDNEFFTIGISAGIIFAGGALTTGNATQNTYNDGEWHTLEVETTETANVFNFTIDGVADNGGSSSSWRQSNAMRIGCAHQSLNSLFFNGQIDRVKAYSGETLLADFKASEGGGTTAYDSSGNGNHGQLVNIDENTFHATANVRPDNLIDGHDLWQKAGSRDIRISFDVSGNSILTDGDTPPETGYTWTGRYETGAWSNNPESKYIWPKCYEIINSDNALSSPFLTDGTGNMVAKSHDDLVPNVLNEDIIFANALDEAKKSKVVITDGTCDFYTLLRIQRELDLIDGPLRITETGEIVRITETDEPIYVTKY